MSLRFLENAQLGKNAAWRYGVGFLLSMGFWIGSALQIEALVGTIIGWLDSFLESGLDQAASSLGQGLQLSSGLFFVANTTPFLFLSIGVGLAVKLLHQRSPRSLVTSHSSIQWRRVCVGFAVWFGFAAVQTIVEFALNPQIFVWDFNPIQWLIFLPIALILTPIQTSAEELFFRGYLLQGLGLVLRRPLVLTIVASLPFALVHFGNPEMQRGQVWIALTYFALAVFLCAVTLRDDRLELALGIHAANNLFIVLFVNTQDSALRSPALIQQTVATDPRVTFGMLVLAIIGSWWIFFRRANPIK
jgi:uncharacterized protein